MSASLWTPFTDLTMRSARAELAYRELLVRYPIHDENTQIRQEACARFVVDVLAKIPSRKERQKVMLGVGMIDRIEE